MGIFTADHVITDSAIFRALADAALNAAYNEDALVTFAVRPTRPDTGYGYLELDDDCLPGSETRYGAPVHHVRRFCEKPERTVAEEYISTGRYFWNSEMFFWRLSSFVRELAEAEPAMARSLADITHALVEGDNTAAAKLFSALPSISIDYALMEKSKHVIAIKAGFSWDDVGSWDALERIQEPDADGNIIIGDPVVLDSRDTVVYNVPGAESMAVGVIGADNLAIVVTPDGVLVCRKDRAQDVRKIVAALKDRGSAQV